MEFYDNTNEYDYLSEDTTNYNFYFDEFNKFKKEHVFTVNEITSIIQNILETEVFRNISVCGEISNLSKSSSGHIYFSLKDETKALLRCVLFKSYLLNINFDFKDGDKVICKGDLKVYKQGSEFNLKVTQIKKEGIGELFQKFEELKLKLKNLGLFDADKKKKIPNYPFNIGVITAETGAVINDIIRTLKRRAPFINIFIFPCQVQGEEASKSIINSLKLANYFSENFEKLDLLILARGGGSIEDLWPFNEEIVAYEIFNSKIPTISAIGHETDFTISDFVSDLRASTPTAAAEIISNNFTTLRDFLEEASYNLMKDFLKLINLKKSKIDLKKNILILNNYLTKKIDNYKFLILSFENNISNLFNNIMIEKKTKIKNLQSLIEALSPENVLKRGYAIIHKKDKIVSSSKNIIKGDKISIQFFDGFKDAKVE